MDDLRSIVVATDFSEGAQRAVNRAALIARERGLPLELLHVVSAPALERVRAWFRDRADLVDRLTTDACDSLSAEAAALATPGTPVHTRLAVGDVAAEIEAASSPEVLLVMGARGETALADLVFGSTAERVVREATGPVLVVRAEPRHAYRNVVVGVDLETSCGALLRDAGSLLPTARLTALHAYQVPFEGALRRAGVREDELERQRGEALRGTLEAITALGREAARDVVAAGERGDAARLLVQHARRIDADLIAVARRSRSPLQALLIGSVARRVVAEADRDVLVLRGPATA
jgi:nucleotide-binding universal stress UspA family protein